MKRRTIYSSLCIDKNGDVLMCIAGVNMDCQNAGQQYKTETI